MMTFTHPRDFTDCCDGLGVNDGHTGLLCMPHLHADNCPLRLAAESGESSSGSPELFFRVDPQELEQFERSLRLHNGDPLLSIASCLDTWGRMHVSKDGSSGSYSQLCFIMANACIEASLKLKKDINDYEPVETDQK